MKDNERQQLAADSLIQSRTDKARLHLAGRLNSLKTAKDPVEAYRQTLPMIRRYAQNMGIDPSELPDEYSPEAIDGWVQQYIDPEDQIRMAALEKYRTDRMEMEKTKEEGRNHRTEVVQDRQDGRTEMVQDRTDKRTQMIQDRTDKRQEQKMNKGGKFIDTPRGKGFLTPDGRLGIVINGEKTVWQKTGNGNEWKRVK
jgi:hypothetical protein